MMNSKLKTLLATKGTDPDRKDFVRRTPLAWAARNGHETVVKLLLATEGVNPNSRISSDGRRYLARHRMDMRKWSSHYN